MNIETIEDLKKALKETGFSNKAVAEIMKWYATNDPPIKYLRKKNRLLKFVWNAKLGERKLNMRQKNSVVRLWKAKCPQCQAWDDRMNRP